MQFASLEAPLYHRESGDICNALYIPIPTACHVICLVKVLYRTFQLSEYEWAYSISFLGSHSIYSWMGATYMVESESSRESILLCRSCEESRFRILTFNWQQWRFKGESWLLYWIQFFGTNKSWEQALEKCYGRLTLSILRYNTGEDFGPANKIRSCP